MRTRSSTVAALAAAPVAFVIVFFGYPLIKVLIRGATSDAWRTLATDPSLRQILWFTLWQAVVSAVLTVVAGLGPAFILARRTFRGRRALLTLVTVPFVLPTVVSGIGFLSLLPAAAHRTVWAVLAAHVWINLALVIRGVGAAWDQLDPDLQSAAATLGASPWQTFRHVIVPLLRPAIVSAASLVFLFCFTSFGIVRLIGGPHQRSIEVEIWRRATQSFDLPVATALAMAQLAVVIAILVRWGRTRPVPHRSGRRAPTALTPIDRVVLTLLTTVVVAPIGAIILRSLHPTPGRWGLAAWRALRPAASIDGRPTLVENPFGTLLTSLRIAAVAAVLAVILGTLAALAIGRARRWGRWLDTGLTVPLGASAVTVGLGLIISFDRGWYDLRGNWLLIPLGQAVVALPVMLRIVVPVIRSIPADQRHVAAVLGASPWSVIRHVDLAVARRAIGAAAGFAVAISLGEFGATSLLTRTGTPTAPIAIARLLGRPSPLNLASACALATLLGALVIIVLAIVDRWREATNAAF
jgi:thiamine transport system permease protein